jgi:O-antigen ligase
MRAGPQAATAAHLRTAPHRLRAGRFHRSDPYLLGRGFLLVMFATALDAWNYLDRGGALRYLVLLVPIAFLVLIRLRSPSPYIRRPMAPDRLLLALLAYGLAGTLFGILRLGTEATTLPIFLPMTIGFLHLGALGDMTDREARLLLRGLEWLGILYLTLAAVVGSGIVPGLAEYRQFRNASLVFVALGIGAAIGQRHGIRALLILLLWGLSFSYYPSGTSVLVALAVVFTLFMVPTKPIRARPYVLGGAFLLAVVLVLLNFGSWVQLSNDYFSLVGKSNNNSTRLAIWTEGIERFQEAPAFGDGFAGPTVTTAVREEGRTQFQLPYHNDYILFLANGGLVGFGLLVAWLIATEMLAVRRHASLLEEGERGKAALLRALLVGYNAYFVTAAFNPTITGASRSATIFAVYGLMMMIRPGREQGSPA